MVATVDVLYRRSGGVIPLAVWFPVTVPCFVYVGCAQFILPAPESDPDFIVIGALKIPVIWFVAGKNGFVGSHLHGAFRNFQDPLGLGVVHCAMTN